MKVPNKLFSNSFFLSDSLFYIRSSIMVFFLCFLVGCVFFQGLFSDFVDLDTPSYVLYNHAISSFNWGSIKHVFLNPIIYYMPFTWVSHMIDYHFFSIHPFGHHLHNLILHLLNAGLVFFLIKGILQRYLKLGSSMFLKWITFVFSLLWAIHPLRVESVLWIANRKGLLVAFWSFLMILVYLKWPLKRWRHYGVLLILYVFALASHPSAISLPFVMLILDFLFVQKTERGVFRFFYRALIKKAPFFGVGLWWAFLTIREHFQLGGITSSFLNDSIFDSIASALHRLYFYIEKTLFPYKLVPIYPFMEGDWTQFSVLFMAIGLGVLFCFFWNKKPIVVAFLTYFLFLLPVLGIVQAGVLSHGDRWTYMSSLSFYIFFAGGTYLCFIRFNFLRRFFALGLGGILIVVALLTQSQIKIWKHSGTFFQACYEAYPNQSSLVLYFFAKQAEGDQHYDKAIGLYQKIVYDFEGSNMGRFGLARIYLKQGKYDAVKALLGLTTYPEGDFVYDQKFMLLAQCAYLEGDYEQCINYLEAITHHFKFGSYQDRDSYYNVLILLAQSYDALGDISQAKHFFYQAYQYYSEDLSGISLFVSFLYKHGLYSDIFDFFNLVMARFDQHVGFQYLYARYCLMIGDIQNNVSLKAQGQLIFDQLLRLQLMQPYR